MDTMMSSQERINAAVTKVWENTPSVDVPISLQPPSVKVRVVVVETERERQKRTRTYPSSVAHESVLMQYAVDTELDKMLVSAFDDVVTQRILGGNPLTTILARAKAAAQRFELWKGSDDVFLSEMLSEPIALDLARQIYCCASGRKATKSKRGVGTAELLWDKVALATGTNATNQKTNISRLPPASAKDKGKVYGLKNCLMLLDLTQLHEMRCLLTDFIPSGAMRVQRYDCAAHVAFCGDSLSIGQTGSISRVQTVQVPNLLPQSGCPTDRLTGL